MKSRHASFFRSWAWRLAYSLLLFVASGAFAAPPIVTANPHTESLRLRKGGPIPLEVELTNRSAGIAEGRLEATVLFRDRHASVEHTGELALVPGARTMTILLPPPPDAEDGDRLGLHLRWLGKESTLDLGEHRLGTYGFSSNELILAVVRVDRRLSDLDVERERSLALENLRPRLDTPGSRSFSTQFATLSPESLPLQPLGWCAYDAVYFDTAAFAAANEKQLAALARWIEAGGSAFISLADPIPAPLRDAQVAFLNRLAGEQGGDFRVENAQLVTSVPYSSLPAGTIQLAPVLGRVSLEMREGTTKDDFKTKAWRESVGWFWRMSAQHLESVRKDGGWLLDGSSDHEWYDDAPEFKAWLWSTAIGFDSISPDKPRPLPLGLVAFLLGTLLLAVGPGDWLLLGWLRRRRWTWILLPVLCLLAAWWANFLAARTIGRIDRSGQVLITDVGPKDQLLRRTQLDMLLPTNDREWVVTVHDGLAIPFPRIVTDAQAGNIEASEVTGEWKTPTTFELHRNLRQWTPAMIQSTSFPEGQDDSNIPWDTLVEQWASLGENRRTLARYSYQGWQVVFLGSDPALFSTGNRQPPIDDFFNLPMSGDTLADDRINFKMAHWLVANAQVNSSAILSCYAPIVGGLGALYANCSTHFIGLAWKETPHELQIVRRHFLKLQSHPSP